MDPEPAPASQPENALTEPPGPEAHEFSGASLVLIGFALALATLGFPVAAVLTDRPSGSIPAPIAQDRDGSPLSVSFTGARSRQPGG